MAGPVLTAVRPCVPRSVGARPGSGTARHRRVGEPSGSALGCAARCRVSGVDRGRTGPLRGSPWGRVPVIVSSGLVGWESFPRCVGVRTFRWGRSAACSGSLSACPGHRAVYRGSSVGGSRGICLGSTWKALATVAGSVRQVGLAWSGSLLRSSCRMGGSSSQSHSLSVPGKLAGGRMLRRFGPTWTRRTGMGPSSHMGSR